MAQHEEPYIKKPEDVGVLGDECGHHCTVTTAGLIHQQVRHCSCTQCHGDKVTTFDPDISQFSNDPSGVDPRGIS